MPWSCPNPAKPRQRKGREVERDIRKEFIARWGKRPITAITPHDVIAVLDEAVARGAPYQAHNVLGYVRRIFNWAIARSVYDLDRSPCDRMRPADVIGSKALRTRVLTDPELRALWRATEALGYPYGPLFQLLILTGQRKSEVAEASWPEFDVERRNVADALDMDAAGNSCTYHPRHPLQSSRRASGRRRWNPCSAAPRNPCSRG